jgi:hypothetical protein
MATTTNRYLIYPALAVGATFASSINWAVNATWVEVVPVNTITSTFYISAIAWQWPSTATTGLYEFLVEIGTGAAAFETTIIQIPTAFRLSTNVGYIDPVLITLPEPVQVAANTRIASRCTTGGATALTITSIKIVYQIV